MSTKKTTKINVTVGRFGEATAKLQLCKGTCLKQALNEIGIYPTENTILRVNGQKAFDDHELKNNDVVLIAGKKEGGSFSEEDDF